MQIFHQLLDNLILKDQRTVLTIGSYDGMHQGHRYIIDRLRQSAKNHCVSSAIIAFHPRPATVFLTTQKSDYLTTTTEKLAIFQEVGLDMAAILPFSLDFAQTPAQTFIEQIVAAFHPLEIWVGADFRFGKGREGDVAFLENAGQTYGFTVINSELQEINGERISSTRIRSALEAGNITEVTHMLGDYPFLLGQVVRGAQRGRKLGFPTANVSAQKEKLLPSNGVYAVWIQVGSDIYPAVANIGVRPTFDETEKTVEVYIFDFDQDIYDQIVRVDWVEYIRPEQSFSGIEALITQIDADAMKARTILTNARKPVHPSISEIPSFAPNLG